MFGVNWGLSSASGFLGTDSAPRHHSELLRGYSDAFEVLKWARKTWGHLWIEKCNQNNKILSKQKYISPLKISP
jgi:hypothetical protein